MVERTLVLSTAKHKVMYKYLLQSVENMNGLAVFSLVLFFAIFLGSTIWIMTRKKDYIDKMSNMPLDDDD